MGKMSDIDIAIQELSEILMKCSKEAIINMLLNKIEFEQMIEFNEIIHDMLDRCDTSGERYNGY